MSYYTPSIESILESVGIKYSLRRTPGYIDHNISQRSETLEILMVIMTRIYYD